MSAVVFVCAFQEPNDWVQHKANASMVQCRRCQRFEVAGYLCELCGHEDVDRPTALAGHGEGKCEAAA